MKETEYGKPKLAGGVWIGVSWVGGLIILFPVFTLISRFHTHKTKKNKKNPEQFPTPDYLLIF